MPDKKTFLEKITNYYNPAIVKINDHKIKDLNFNNFVSIDTIEPLPGFISSPEEALIYSLALNSINYQFWDKNDQNFYRYTHQNSVGALAMFNAFQKMYQELGSYQKIINLNKNKDFFNQEIIKKYFGNIPDVDSRLIILNEIFDEYLPQLAKMILKNAKAHHCFTIDDASYLSEAFPLSYQDDFLKKAQLSLILASNYLKPFNLNLGTDFTVCADYQLPKVLEHLKILSYSDSLKDDINNMKVIPAFSQQEHALRAATVIACEKICSYHHLNPADLDYWLWLKRNEPKTNFHLTKTTLY